MSKLPPPKKKKKPPSLTKLKKEADRVFSLHIRQKYANKEGIVKCYTCSYVGHWKKMQNGHLVSRFYLATRYDPRNCRPQCITCNIWRNGRTPEFALNLQKELGPGIVEDLYAEARVLTKNFDYQAVIDLYKEKGPASAGPSLTFNPASSTLTTSLLP